VPAKSGEEPVDRPRIGVFIVAACVAGCATAWVRPDAESVDLNHENVECQFEASKLTASAGLEGLDESGLNWNLCMEARAGRVGDPAPQIGGLTTSTEPSQGRGPNRRTRPGACQTDCPPRCSLGEKNFISPRDRRPADLDSLRELPTCTIPLGQPARHNRAVARAGLRQGELPSCLRGRSHDRRPTPGWETEMR
jgi:hypothetical protein